MSDDENEMSLEGTLTEIGAQVFANICLPLLMDMRMSGLCNPGDVAQLYAGFVGAALGSFAAEFGVAEATAFGKKMTDGVAVFVPPEDASAGVH